MTNLQMRKLKGWSRRVWEVESLQVKRLRILIESWWHQRN